MFKPPRRAVCLLLATATWIQHGTYAYSVPLLHDAILFERASTCSSGFSPCVDTGLPNNFCCATNAVCNPLAGNTTVICCPLGSDCSQISPITCDIQKQNVDIFPDAPIKTTALNGVLGKCGDSTCCPFGYSCSSSKDFCIRNANQNAAPLQNVPTSSATTPASTVTTSSTTFPTTAKTTSKASTTSTDVPLTVVPQTSFVSTVSTASTTSKTPATSAAAAQTSTATSAQSTALSDTDKPSSSPSKASIAGGVVGGFAGVLLVSAALWFFCNRRRRRSGTPNNMGGFANGQPGTGKSSNSMSSFGNIINNPLNISISSPKPQNDALLYRSDFIRKPPPSRDDALPPIPAADAAIIDESDRAVHSVSPLSINDGGGLRLSPRPLMLRQSQQPQQQKQQQPTDSIAASRESAMEMEINVGVDPRMFLDGGSFTVSPTATSPTTLPPATMMRSVASTPLGYEDARYRDPRYLETMPTLAPPRPRRSQDRLTTFSGLMREANLDPQRPFVPQGTPDSRLR